MLLYAVTDRAWIGTQTLYQQVEAALKGGATCVQLREKELDEAAFLQEVGDLPAQAHGAYSGGSGLQRPVWVGGDEGRRQGGWLWAAAPLRGWTPMWRTG